MQGIETLLSIPQRQFLNHPKMGKMVLIRDVSACAFAIYLFQQHKQHLGIPREVPNIKYYVIWGPLIKKSSIFLICVRNPLSQIMQICQPLRNMHEANIKKCKTQQLNKSEANMTTITMPSSIHLRWKAWIHMKIRNGWHLWIMGI